VAKTNALTGASIAKVTAIELHTNLSAIADTRGQTAQFGSSTAWSSPLPFTGEAAPGG
jgi:hypothetical protein